MEIWVFGFERAITTQAGLPHLFNKRPHNRLRADESTFASMQADNRTINLGIAQHLLYYGSTGFLSFKNSLARFRERNLNYSIGRGRLFHSKILSSHILEHNNFCRPPLIQIPQEANTYILSCRFEGLFKVFHPLRPLVVRFSRHRQRH